MKDDTFFCASSCLQSYFALLGEFYGVVYEVQQNLFDSLFIAFDIFGDSRITGYTELQSLFLGEN